MVRCTQATHTQLSELETLEDPPRHLKAVWCVLKGDAACDFLFHAPRDSNTDERIRLEALGAMLTGIRLNDTHDAQLVSMILSPTGVVPPPVRQRLRHRR